MGIVHKSFDAYLVMHICFGGNILAVLALPAALGLAMLFVAPLVGEHVGFGVAFCICPLAMFSVHVGEEQRCDLLVDALQLLCAHKLVRFENMFGKPVM